MLSRTQTFWRLCVLTHIPSREFHRAAGQTLSRLRIGTLAGLLLGTISGRCEPRQNRAFPAEKQRDYEPKPWLIADDKNIAGRGCALEARRVAGVLLPVDAVRLSERGAV
jgi:hypothetical protein